MIFVDTVIVLLYLTNLLLKVNMLFVVLIESTYLFILIV